MPRKCTGHSKNPLPTTQRRLYTWTSPDGQHQIQIDYILCSQRWRSAYSQLKQDQELTGSDHELLIANFRLKLKKVWKTIRPFTYDLNQTPYDYTVEVMNRCKGLDLVDRVPEELWTEVRNTVQEVASKTIPKKKKRKKEKWLSEKALQIADERETGNAQEKKKHTQLNAEFQRMARRDEKAFFSE